MKIYCEPGALTKRLRKLQRTGKIELVHFPYDDDLRARAINPGAVPSAAQLRDLNLTWDEAGQRGFTWNDFNRSPHLAEILRIVGQHNRRDALHVDSAYKEGCAAFVTRDGNILDRASELEPLLGIRFFHPDRDSESLEEFIEGQSGAA
jgi:hypothetical protein